MNDLIEWMESKITLHYTFEFLYVVDGYEVDYIHDSGRSLQRAHGVTLKEAIENVRRLMER